MTDEDGKFRIEDLVPGEEVTIVCSGTRETESATLRVKVGTDHVVIVAPYREDTK